MWPGYLLLRPFFFVVLFLVVLFFVAFFFLAGISPPAKKVCSLAPMELDEHDTDADLARQGTGRAQNGGFPL